MGVIIYSRILKINTRRAIIIEMMGSALPWIICRLYQFSSPIPPIFFLQQKKMGEKNAGRGKPLHPYGLNSPSRLAAACGSNRGPTR